MKAIELFTSRKCSDETIVSGLKLKEMASCSFVCFNLFNTKVN